VDRRVEERGENAHCVSRFASSHRTIWRGLRLEIGPGGDRTPSQTPMKSGILSLGTERYRQKYLHNKRRAVSAAFRLQFESTLFAKNLCESLKTKGFCAHPSCILTRLSNTTAVRHGGRCCTNPNSSRSAVIKTRQSAPGTHGIPMPLDAARLQRARLITCTSPSTIQGLYGQDNLR
jgi:hypothetical protein